MSERKTAEIKFRCTPSFKASVQAAAQAANKSMSELLEEAYWSMMNQSFDGTRLLNGAIDLLRENDANVPQCSANGKAACTRQDCAEGVCRPGAALIEGDVVANGPVSVGDIVRDVQTGEIIKVVALADEGRVPVACSCRPWEFCTHKERA